MKRVVVTGLGILCPLGNDLPSVVDALRQGRSGIRAMPQWEVIKGLRSRVAGVVTGFDPKRVPRQARRTMGRLGLMAALAAEDGVRSASLEPELLTSGEVGLAIGSTMGSPKALEETFSELAVSSSIERQKGTNFPKAMGHTAAANTAVFLALTGPVLAPTSACASSTQAIGLGYEMIRHGMVSTMLCGGGEELHPMSAGTFDIVHAASRHYNDRPQTTPRPFDVDRDGLVASEGAGILVLEELERARARDAPILAEILGFATFCDGKHVTQPASEGMVRCMRQALSCARVEPGDIEYINAHATGTQIGDATEASSIRQVLGDSVPVSSSKGHVGHTLAACGAIEACFCIAMMREGFLAPTLNLSNVDEACSGIMHPSGVISTRVSRILSNSFAFGGINASLVIGAV